MKKSTKVYTAAGSLLSASIVVWGCAGAIGTAPINSQQPALCATESPSITEQFEIEAQLTAFETSRAPKGGGNGGGGKGGGGGGSSTISVPVYVHVITTDTGEGDVTDATIAEQITILNEAFSGIQDTGGFDTDFEFVFVSTDRTANSAWYYSIRHSADERAMKTALRQGSAIDLNIYIKTLEGSLGGYGAFPWLYAGDPVMDGIVIRDTTMPGGTYGGYNLGDVAVHEIGHWLGLFHTYQGGCSSPNDSVNDTPAAAGPNYACPVSELDTCTGGKYKGKDPTMNFMDSTPDGCKWQFTKGHHSRMSDMWGVYRAGN